MESCSGGADMGLPFYEVVWLRTRRGAHFTSPCGAVDTAHRQLVSVMCPTMCPTVRYHCMCSSSGTKNQGLGQSHLHNLRVDKRRAELLPT